MTNENESYNGWANYQTWKVALNIDNEESTYNESRDLIRYNRVKNGDDLKAWFCEIAQTQEQGFYRLCDSWSESELNEVDFDEIYNNYAQEFEEEENEADNEADIKNQLENEMENQKEKMGLKGGED
jgi:hypothetical protein